MSPITSGQVTTTSGFATAVSHGLRALVEGGGLADVLGAPQEIGDPTHVPFGE